MPKESVQSGQIAARHSEILGQPPRLQPLARATVAQEVQATTAKLLRGIAGAKGAIPEIPVAQIPEIMFTLCRFPELWQALMNVTVEIQGPRCTLPPRDRKLAILRTGWLCQAPYEFGEHVEQAKRIGFSSEEIEWVVEGPGASGWTEHESALLTLVDELHAGAMVSDRTWTTLAQSLDDRQLFELLIVVGQFTATAYFQNALRLRLEPGGKGLAAR